MDSLREEQGAAISEYALLLAFIAVLLVGTVGLFRQSVAGLFQTAINGWPL
jgi:Flp pilus assembly pilin Flp